MKRLLCVLSASAVLAAGCSGPVSAPQAPSGLLPEARTDATAGRGVRATVTIRIPKKVRVRRARFVSPSTQSAAMTIQPGVGCAKCSPGFTRNIGLTTASKGCAATSTGTACTFAFVLRPGTYGGSMTTYDGPLVAGKPTGTILSFDRSFPVNVASGKANVFPIALYGIPAGAVCFPLTAASIAIPIANCKEPLLEVAAGTTSRFAVYAVDVDGNVMLGPGSPQFSAIATGFSFTTAGSTIAIKPPVVSNAIVPVTIAASSPACSASGAVCSFAGAIVFDSIVAVANDGNNSVVLYSHLTLESGAGPPYAVIKNGISGPIALAFDSSGHLFVANSTNNTVTEYAPPYTGAPIAKISTSLIGPYLVAVGKGGELAVVNGGSDSAEVYAPPYTAAPVNLNLAFSTPTAIAFDSNQNLWVAFYSNIVDRYSASSGYTSVDYLLSHASNGITKPTALALDAANNLYVGEGKVDVFPVASSYSGMPAHSSNAVAGLSSVAADGSHGEVVACGSTDVNFFRTSDLSEFYLSTYATANGCQAAFDRTHDVSFVLGTPATARTLSYDTQAGLWNASRWFESTYFSSPVALATWP